VKVRQDRLLDKGQIESLAVALLASDSTNPELAEKIRTKANYFERNAARMNYAEFHREHLFDGSGVIEAGGETVIGSRLKQSRILWTVQGANAIIALRCCHIKGAF